MMLVQPHTSENAGMRKSSGAAYVQVLAQAKIFICDYNGKNV